MVATFEAERDRMQEALDERDQLADQVDRLERVAVHMRATEKAKEARIFPLFRVTDLEAKVRSRCR